ncbi:MAG: NAD(P)-binding domain-containing protein [Paludibacteraceae bacterium]|nr:NAD(P)-binding domain-containing protein [Paludibacteraceae bacterium]
MKIIVDTSLPQEWMSPLLTLSSRDVQLVHWGEKQWQDADVLMSNFYMKVTKEVLNQLPNLKLITQFGVGYDNIDVTACQERGVIVTNTPQPVIEPTAELCMALIMGVARRTAELDRTIRNNQVEFGLLKNLGTSLYGKTLGIVGLGNIGRSVARRAIACGMKIIYHNRKPVSDEVLRACQITAEYVPLEHLLQTADFVSLNLPYSTEVRHLIGEREFKMMKPSAFLINTARGAHVDEDALISALKHGEIAGAALDVYEHEPQISEGLKELPNVLMVPHVGTGTWEGRKAMCDAILDNIIAFIEKDYTRMTIVNSF